MMWLVLVCSILKQRSFIITLNILSFLVILLPLLLTQVIQHRMIDLENAMAREDQPFRRIRRFDKLICIELKHSDLSRPHSSLSLLPKQHR